MLRLPAAAALAVFTVLLVPGAANAGDPIIPLSQVQSGMRCTGYSVIRGTDISSFDVEVLDVLGGPDPQILVRVSGQAVEPHGIAEGFSGSPVKCPDADGTLRTIGAIAQGTGDYGNKVVLATPIELLLGEPVDPPVGAKPMSRALRRAVRPLATPISFGGISGPVADALRAAGRRTGRALYAAPAGPRGAFPVPAVQAGSSVAVGLASGDISAGVVGTVSYVDGDAVWAFGHPLDGAGRRSLLLQSAHVSTVIDNPIDTEQTTSYKLATPGAAIGTLTNDAPPGVVGRLGALPRMFPLRVTASDLDRGRVLRQTMQIADETDVGLPTGTSSLSQVAPIAVAQAVYSILRGAPARQSGDMCVRVALRERRVPLRFCNRYVGGSPEAAGAPLVADVAAAMSLIDSYNFAALHVTGVDVNVHLRRDLRQAYLLDATGPRAVRRGRDARITVVAQHVRGARFRRRVKVHVPSSLSPGTHTLTLTGTPADATGSSDGTQLADVFTVTLGDEGDVSDDQGPTTLDELAAAFADTHREDGLVASFRERGGDASSDVVVLRDKNVRLSGQIELELTVRR